MDMEAESRYRAYQNDPDDPVNTKALIQCLARKGLIGGSTPQPVDCLRVRIRNANCYEVIMDHAVVLFSYQKAVAAVEYPGGNLGRPPIMLRGPRVSTTTSRRVNAWAREFGYSSAQEHCTFDRLSNLLKVRAVS